MALTRLNAPFPVFTDTDGTPLDAGFVYVGVENENPETSPITVYYDIALTQAAAQPLRTLNGYIMRNGSPAALYASVNYSLTVRNSNSALVIAVPTSAGAATGVSLVAANNLSDVDDAATSLANLGLTATAAEINKLDGLNATRTELDYTVGVTSAIQTQINTKAPAASPTFTGVPAAPTATLGTDTTQIATTAFVQAAVDAGGTDWEFVETIATTSGTTVEFPSTGTLDDGYVYAVEMLEVEHGAGANRELQLSLYGATAAAYVGPANLGIQVNSEGIFGFAVLPSTLRVAMNDHQLPASQLAGSASSGTNFVGTSTRESESPVFHFATAQKVDKVRFQLDSTGSFDNGSMKLWRKVL